MSSRPIGRRTALSGLAAVPMLIACQGKTNRGRGEPAATGDPSTSSARDLATILQRIEGRETTDGEGATLRRIFPARGLEHLDPFVLLDDFHVSRPAGFPRHPHLGFEAFTYMIDGAFEHKDSMGNESTVSTGGTQRFCSGKGAYHSEMPGRDGVNRGLQLWINLPRRLKKMTPEYQAAEDLPLEQGPTRTTRQILGRGSPQEIKTAVDYADVTLLADDVFTREVEDGWNTLLYVIEGEARIGAQSVPRGSGVLLSPGKLEAQGPSGTRFAYLSGKPHGEPIYHKGPFVY